jgi:hypothetical protein
MKSDKTLMKSRVTVANTRAESSKLWLEPWGAEYDLAAGEHVELLFLGPAPSDPEVSIDDTGITVWGWTGSTVRVVKDGKTISSHEGKPVPQLPVATKSTA